MSLTLGYFSKFPAAYKEREKLVNDVIFTEITYNKSEDQKILVNSRTNKYFQEMEIEGETINLHANVKVFCSCESFKYEFANSIFKSGSLKRPISFIRSIISRPKQKNEHNIPSGCKHIVALSRKIIKIKINRSQ